MLVSFYYPLSIMTLSCVSCLFFLSGLQCTNEGQRIRQKWQPYPEKLLTPRSYASLLSFSPEVVITPGEGVKYLKAEVEAFLYDIWCAVLWTVASDLDVGINVRQFPRLWKETLLTFPYDTHTSSWGKNNKYSTTSTLLWSALRRSWEVPQKPWPTWAAVVRVTRFFPLAVFV